MRISRQNKILELIETHEIETQDMLVSLLREYGYDVTQPTRIHVAIDTTGMST